MDRDYLRQQRESLKRSLLSMKPLIQSLWDLGLRKNAEGFIKIYNEQAEEVLKINRELKRQRRLEQLEVQQEQFPEIEVVNVEPSLEDSTTIAQVVDTQEEVVQLLEKEPIVEVFVDDHMEDFEVTIKEAPIEEAVIQDGNFECAIVESNHKVSILERKEDKGRGYSKMVDALYNPPKFLPAFAFMVEDELEDGQNKDFNMDDYFEDVGMSSYIVHIIFDPFAESVILYLNKIRGRIFFKEGGNDVNIKWIMGQSLFNIHIHGGLDGDAPGGLG